MTETTIEYLDKLPSDIDDKVTAGHIAFEASHGIICDHRSFSIVARDTLGEVVGVLSASMYFAEVYVEDLWVDANHRQRGIGTKLMFNLEQACQGKGFSDISLQTSAFQAQGFYEKCGYVVEFSRNNSHHPKLSKIFMIKYFADSTHTRGILSGKSGG